MHIIIISSKQTHAQNKKGPETISLGLRLFNVV